MHVEELYFPSYSLAIIKLSPNEYLRLEDEAMVTMSQEVTI
jgi:uncharacterized protein (AIM24 family)